MRRLIAKSAFLLVLVAVIESAIVLCPISRRLANHSYLDVWSSKHAHLAASGYNRIIVAGGSNVAFGVDSSRLERITRRPVINLGLHGGLGLALMVHEVQDQARAGDLVLLIPEYEQFYADTMNGNAEAAEILQRDWAALPYFSSWRQWRSLAMNGQVLAGVAAFGLIDSAKMRLLGTPASQPDRSVYRKDAFNEHGDMVGHLAVPPQPGRVAAGFARITGEFNPRAISAIARCAEILSGRGVQFAMLYPSIASGFWDVNQDLAEQVAEQSQTQWTLSQPQDWVFPDQWFFDTPYHLHTRGREIRTDRLARVIQALEEGESGRVSFASMQ